MNTLEDATRELTISRYANIVSFVILYYDFCVTFDEEYSRYWTNSHLTWTVFLFYLVRYLSIFGHIPVMLHVFVSKNISPSQPLCNKMLLYHQIFAVVIQILVAILLTVRTYALYNRNRKVLVATVALGICGVAVACWAVLTPHGPPPLIPTGLLGCNNGLTDLQGIYFAIAWSGMLVFDGWIFALTLVRGIILSRRARRTLFDIMLRDGSVYFACMAGANLANIVTFVVCPPLLKGSPTMFTNVISTTLICRLMLNIRDPRILRQSRSHTTSTHNSVGPLTRSDFNAPFYSTLYPVDGNISAVSPTFADNPEMLSSRYAIRESEYLELRPVPKHKQVP